VIENPQVAAHPWLAEMMDDDYFPDRLVAKGQQILIRLAEAVEAQRPDLAGLYVLGQAAAEEFNELQEEFFEAGSEIETAAREAIAEDFGFIADSYGYTDVDIEELIATRDW
jgi:hypothetical protein